MSKQKVTKKGTCANASARRLRPTSLAQDAIVPTLPFAIGINYDGFVALINNLTDKMEQMHKFILCFQGKLRSKSE